MNHSNIKKYEIGSISSNPSEIFKVLAFKNDKAKDEIENSLSIVLVENLPES